MSDELKKVIIYTDGACMVNPGPGGYGVVLIHEKHRKEFSGGYSLTTNNRMEIMAAIVGLRALKFKCSVTIYTDSQYLADSIMKGWARRWRARGWKKKSKGKALNSDLWEELLTLCDRHEVQFVWIKGHAGNVENERCDHLSVQAALAGDLPPDTGYNPQEELSAEPSLFDLEMESE